MNTENGGRTILTNPWDSYAQNQKIRYPFTRQLMFAKVMEDPELCRIFLERLFEGRKVKDVVMHGVETVTAEATKIPGVFQNMSDWMCCLRMRSAGTISNSSASLRKTCRREAVITLRSSM